MYTGTYIPREGYPALYPAGFPLFHGRLRCPPTVKREKKRESWEAEVLTNSEAGIKAALGSRLVAQRGSLTP